MMSGYKKIFFFVFCIGFFMNHISDMQCQAEEILGSYGTIAESEGSWYYGEIDGGVQNGYGVIKSDSGEWFAAEFENGMANGMGVILYPDGVNMLRGRWNYNMYAEDGGLDEWNDSQGNYYYGTSDENGQLAGKGLFVAPGIVNYIGYFQDGSLTGKGFQSTQDGFVIGEFSEGMLSGKYLAHYYESDVWIEGYSTDGNMSGYGIYQDSDKRYEGELLFGLPDGYGVSFELDGDVDKIGIWTMGEFEQQDNLECWKDEKGTVFAGTKNANGNIEGKGIAVLNGNYSYVGDFVNGIAQGEGAEFKTDGNWYCGQWENGLQNGYGIYFFINGNYYAGDVKNQIYEGYGKGYMDSGMYYEGQWSNDKRNGLGILFEADGSVVEMGIWKDNEFQADSRFALQIDEKGDVIYEE